MKTVLSVAVAVTVLAAGGVSGQSYSVSMHYGTGTLAPMDVYAVEEPDVLVTFDVSYRTLAPHGRWLFDRTYGQVWQPYEAIHSRGWRPYVHEGRWLWTTAGWYWQSHYQWGWIPFHYGRWAFTRHWGWVWVPGSQWAPAWVHWRYSQGHAGWAPLPPGADYQIGYGFSYHGRRVAVDFHFGLTEERYVFMPAHRVATCAPAVSMVHVQQVPMYYRGSTVIYQDYRTVNNVTVFTGLPPERVYRQAPVPAPRPVTRSSRHGPSGGRLDRVMHSATGGGGAASTSSSRGGGRLGRVVSTTTAAPRTQTVAPAPRQQPVFSSAGGSRQARVTTATSSPAVSQPAANTVQSRVVQVREFYRSRGR